MQTLGSEPQEVLVAPAAPACAEIARRHDEDEEPEVGEVLGLVQGIVYWSVLGVGVLAPVIGVLYGLLTH